MNNKLKLIVNHYEGNLSKIDYQVQFLVKRGKSFARRKLFIEMTPEYSYIKTYKHLYHQVKGLSRLLVRTREFGYFISKYRQEYIIERNNIKESLFNMLLLKDGGSIDLEADMVTTTRTFYKFKKKYEMGFIDRYGYPTEKYYKVTKPRVSKSDLYECFSEFKREFSYYSENDTSCVKIFINELLNNINNFTYDRIGKIYVDLLNSDKSSSIERVYLHKEGFMNICNSFYDIYDQIDYILSQLKMNSNYKYEIKVSKNR